MENSDHVQFLPRLVVVGGRSRAPRGIWGVAVAPADTSSTLGWEGLAWEDEGMEEGWERVWEVREKEKDWEGVCEGFCSSLQDLGQHMELLEEKMAGKDRGCRRRKGTRTELPLGLRSALIISRISYVRYISEFIPFIP